MRNTLLAFLLAALSPLALSSVAPAQDDDMKEVEIKVGNKITHLRFDGEWVTGQETKRLDASKVYVVDHWSPAAPLCKRAIPYLNQLYQDFGAKGLMVIGVSLDKEDTVRKFMKDKMSYMTYPIGARKKGEDSGISEMWTKFARHSGVLPVDFIVNRAGQICYVGSPLEPAFEKILRLCLDDRYDPELNKKAEDMIAAARRAAKIRNFREATRLYDQVVDLSPRHFTEIALEHWRMISEQVQDAAAAKAYLRKLIERVVGDEPTLIYIGNYLALNTEIKNRDLEAATIVAAALRKKGATNSESLGCIAAAQAANGDFEAAAETQYDAWMTAPPTTKPAFKRSLDNYRAGKLRSGSDAPSDATAGTTTEPKTPSEPKAPAEPKKEPDSKPATGPGTKETQPK